MLNKSNKHSRKLRFKS